LYSATLKKGNLTGIIRKIFNSKEEINKFAKEKGFKVISIIKN